MSEILDRFSKGGIRVFSKEGSGAKPQSLQGENFAVVRNIRASVELSIEKSQDYSKRRATAKENRVNSFSVGSLRFLPNIDTMMEV